MSFLMFIFLGERGGATFFHNLKLAIPGLITGLAAVISFSSGVIAIIKYKERSIPVFVTTVLFFFVTLYLVMEIFSKH